MLNQDEDNKKKNTSTISKFKEDYIILISELDDYKLKFRELNKEIENQNTIIINLNNMLENDDHLIKRFKEENELLKEEKGFMKQNVKYF